MLRQPQLHNQGPRASVGTSLPPESRRQNTRTHTRSCTRSDAHNPAVAMGDRGVSTRVWHALSQVAQENDDSWQLTVWHPPHPPHPQKSAPPLPLPPHPSHPPTLPSVRIFTSLSIPLQCLLWYSNSTSTCLDSSTWKPVCFPAYIFDFLSHSVSLSTLLLFLFLFLTHTNLYFFG